MTIFGESAGSMSVMFHLLSKESRGLFSGAIMQSGSTMSAFSGANSKSPAYYGRTYADGMGCDAEASTKSILECMQGVSTTLK